MLISAVISLTSHIDILSLRIIHFIIINLSSSISFTFIEFFIKLSLYWHFRPSYHFISISLFSKLSLYWHFRPSNHFHFTFISLSQCCLQNFHFIGNSALQITFISLSYHFHSVVFKTFTFLAIPPFNSLQNFHFLGKSALSYHFHFTFISLSLNCFQNFHFLGKSALSYHFQITLVTLSLYKWPISITFPSYHILHFEF